MRARGKRRGKVPDEELEWLRDNIECESIRKLYAEYSEEFGSPYGYFDSFLAMLWRNNIFPIPQTTQDSQPNLNRFLLLFSQGETHWTYTPKPKDKTAEPHWLWRWHIYSYRQPTGITFKSYPTRLKEKQFVKEDLDDRDSH
jgi:hypothetical protein